MTTPHGTVIDIPTVLESSFREVIETMVGMGVEGPEQVVQAGGMNIAGLVGLASPEFRGLLKIATTDQGARTFAAALLGGEDMLGDDPSMVADSLGELANMLAGSVKRQLDGSGSRIELSLPSVLEGEARVHGIGATGDALLFWTVEGYPVQVGIVYSESMKG